MDEIVNGLIVELKKTIRFVDLRNAPLSSDYLEGVFLREDLARCYELLVKVFGPPIKELGQAPAFTPGVQTTVNALGGIRANQCLFLVQQGARDIAYAALWPWESDPTRVTLRVGTWQEP